MSALTRTGGVQLQIKRRGFHGFLFVACETGEAVGEGVCDSEFHERLDLMGELLQSLRDWCVYYWLPTGGVASLNHRLITDIPIGMGDLRLMFLRFLGLLLFVILTNQSKYCGLYLTPARSRNSTSSSRNDCR